MAHIVVDAGDIGPIAFDRDDIETVLLDQAPRDRRACRVELMRTVRRLTQQHDPGVAKAIESIGKVRCLGNWQRFCRLP